MAMQQMARRMASRIFAAGATRPSIPETGHLSYDSGAFSTRGGVPFSTRRFFCSEPPSPPRRTQFVIDNMPVTLFLGCKAVGFDVHRAFVNILINGQWDLVRDLVEDDE